MSKGRHEAGGSTGWQKTGDPFQEEKAPKKPKIKVKKEKNAYGWNGMSKAQKAAAVVGCCLAVLIAAGAGWWLMFVRSPDVSSNVLPSTADNDPDRHPSQIDQLEGNDVNTSTKVPGRKDDVYTFLLLGKDTGGGGNTDTMILVTYDVPNAAVNCLSIPRDTMINVTWSIKKINAVYASKRGIEGLREEVGYLTGIVPDFYVAVEWEAIGEIVDALGGVEFDVPYDMNYDDPYQKLHIHQKKGLRKLSGDDAMQVIRWRQNNDPNTLKSTYSIGDDGRQKIQQDFLKAVAKQCLQLGNWTKISQFAQIFFENVETDIKLENMLWFAQKAMGVDMDNVTFFSMPGNFNGWYGAQSYVFADPAGVVELVNEHFNPYSRDITEDDLQIMYKTKSGGLAVTNGTLASASMANPPSSSKSSTSTATTATEPEETTPENGGEAVLPEENETVDPGTGTTNPGIETDPGITTDPGTVTDLGITTDPGTVTDPGITTDPGTVTDPGTTTDPGTVTDPGTTTDPGTSTDPGTTTDPGTVTDPETPADPGTTVDPGTTAEPAPEPEPGPPSDPAPELPSEPGPEPVLPEE